MTRLRQSYEVAKYHKKMTLFFFLLFGLFLLALSFISQLLSTQATTLSFISNKLKDIKKIFPQMSEGFGDHLVESNQSMTYVYHGIYLGVIICSLFAFFLFSFFTAKIRKDEINSMYYIGIKKTNIVSQLLSALIVPITLSCTLLFLFFLVCQQQIVTQSLNINQKILTTYFDEYILLPEKTDSVPKPKITKKTHSTVSSGTTSQTLIPYNKLSMLEVEMSHYKTKDTFLSLFKDIFTLIITSLIGSFAGFYTYTTFCFRRRSLA